MPLGPGAPTLVPSGSLPLSGLYPGDSYVDWSCIDGYNWNYKWTPFSTMLGPTYDVVQAIAPSKPLLIGETASTETGGSKAAWITDALTVSLPAISRTSRESSGSRSGRTKTGQSRPRRASRSAFAAGIATPLYAGADFVDVRSPIPPLTPVVSGGAAGGESADTLGGSTGSGGAQSLPTTKRCVARTSKTTGKRVLVCKKASVIESLAIESRIRPGFSLPVVVPAANAAIRITLTRDTKVVMQFARRSGKKYVAVPGSVKLKLLRGQQGVLFAGRLSSKRTLDPGRYRLAVTALSSTGTRSQTVRGTFTLLK